MFSVLLETSFVYDNPLSLPSFFSHALLWKTQWVLLGSCTGVWVGQFVSRSMASSAMATLLEKMPHSPQLLTECEASYWAWSFPLDCLPRKSPGSALCLLNSGVIGMYHVQLLHMHRRFELRSLCLCSKHCTHRPTSSVSQHTFFSKLGSLCTLWIVYGGLHISHTRKAMPMAYLGCYSHWKLF